MVSALASELSGPGSCPGRGHCVVFLGKTLNSRSASLHPGEQMPDELASHSRGNRNTPRLKLTLLTVGKYIKIAFHFGVTFVVFFFQ